MHVSRYAAILFLTFLVFVSHAQQTDTTQQLPEVIIKAFEQNRRLRDVPAAINYVSKATLERFSPGSIVQAVNTTPGIRMEERSPGSYRFNIRGSSLRSPFGVRNVKVYFNDIPITDPGGHTYLNQLGYYNFNSIEIIKGPGSSLYGAGTGGVLLIESLPVGQTGFAANEQPSLFAEYATGSYGLQNIYGSIAFGGDQSISKAGFQHQQSGGYRNHSELMRNVFSWNSRYQIGEKNELKTTFLYGHLFYETPGALTRAEFEANPRTSRPGNIFFPGAEAARASINQKQFIAGASYDQQLFSNFTNNSVLYGIFTELRNPTIQNFGRSSEPHVGGRTTFRFSQPLSSSLIHVDVGGELQRGFTSVSIHKNSAGNQDSLRTYDDINNRQSLLFAQAAFDHQQWTVTAGASLNFLKINFERFAPGSGGKQRRTFNNEWAPRFAVMKKFNGWNIYSSVAKGFSPPTTAELLPTGGAVNLNLNAEEGINYDIGVKGSVWRNLYVDVNAFIFSLQNTIVQRRTAGGGDFFVNAGKTKQHGIETFISHPLFSSAIMENSLFWLSHTWHNFHYKEFKQVNNDFSGNQLPGVAPHVVSTGFDYLFRNGILGTLSYYFSDRIPLNDANSEFADDYHLVAAKLGLQKWFANKLRMKILAGVDNLLNQKYSLGNDINGFGGRYYNAAAGRNYFAALVLQLATKPKQAF